MRYLIRPKDDYDVSGYLEWTPTGPRNAERWYPISQARVFPEKMRQELISRLDKLSIAKGHLLVEGYYNAIDKEHKKLYITRFCTRERNGLYFQEDDDIMFWEDLLVLGFF